MRQAAAAGATQALTLLALVGATTDARAQLVPAEPLAPITPAAPAGETPREAQVVLQVVVDATGHVESAVESSRLPRDVSDAWASAAIDAVKGAPFSPTLRDGRPARSRIEYVVVFHSAPSPSLSAALPAASSPVATATPSGPGAAKATTARTAQEAPSPPASGATPAVEDVEVHGVTARSPRGIGDVRVDRETLTASPRQQTSEMLSAAPGFFVDHEDGEGLGNDVYLRGFDLDSGSGFEMKVDEVPINVPLHIHGQGYADVNFIIPEVVSGVHVQEGTYDPRQGDAAIVGSARFELGVAERGYRVKTTYGSFDQVRVVGIAAPAAARDETFVAFSLRQTQGFGEDRASKSASLNAQYGTDLGGRDHLRVLATAYASSAALPGVVRLDDVQAGRIGYYDAYSSFNAYFPTNCMAAPCSQPAQGVQTARVIVGANFAHETSGGAGVELAPWLMWTNFLSRQNYTGNLESSNLLAQLNSLGDLWQLTNVETAAGFTARVRTGSLHLGRFLEVVMEPGVFLRAGHTAQSKDLVNPADLAPWDYRENYSLNTVDLAGYVDVDLRFWKKLRVSGGVRADFLDVFVTDNLAGVAPPVPGALPGSNVDVAGVAPGPRATAAYELAPALTPAVSAGEGFRSLDAGSLTLCNAQIVPSTGGAPAQAPPCVPGAPFSRVTSFEAGFRSELFAGRLVGTVTAFQTRVANELVFEVASGGLQTENASTRRGVVGSVFARPAEWLLASSAVSVQTATFDTLVVGSSHYVPNVPSFLWRADLNLHHDLARVGGAPLAGRAGLGYTLLGGRHVNDSIVTPANNVLNANASLRYRWAEFSFDMFNVLGLKYADDEEYFVSNWSTTPAPARASSAIHVVAAPPRTALGTLTLSL